MSCAEQLRYRYRSTNILDITLEDEDSEPINDATVEVTLIDADGAEVAGATWPIAMNYVATTAGEYTAALVHSLDVVVNGEYTAQLVIDRPNGYHAEPRRSVIIEEG